MHHALDLLREFGVQSESKIVSAHRTPDLLVEFAKQAASQGLQVIIAGAGGAAHLPGMLAAYTHLPVLGVPIESRVLKGVDSLLSIVQMPAGIPVPTLAIGEAAAECLRVIFSDQWEHVQFANRDLAILEEQRP